MSTYAVSLVSRLRAILGSSDLSTISAKAVRKQLVEQGEREDLVKIHRKDVDQYISSIYDELTAGQASTPSSDEIPLTSTSTNHHNNNDTEDIPFPQSSLPEPLRSKPSKVKSEIKDEKPKVSGTSSSSSSYPPRAAVPAAATAETDAQMAARLQREFDSLNNGRSSRSAGSSSTSKPKKKKTPVKKRKSKATVGSDDDDDDGDGTPKKKKRAGGGGGGNNVFNKEMVLSDSLAAFVGEARLSRPQTVKRIWDYVKEKGLQDASDKRFIICDDRLRGVFHTDRLHMFTMNKYLSQHFRDPDDIIYKGEAGEVKPKGQAKSEEIIDSDSEDEE